MLDFRACAVLRYARADHAQTADPARSRHHNRAHRATADCRGIPATDSHIHRDQPRQMGEGGVMSEMQFLIADEIDELLRDPLTQRDPDYVRALKWFVRRLRAA